MSPEPWKIARKFYLRFVWGKRLGKGRKSWGQGSLQCNWEREHRRGSSQINRGLQTLPAAFTNPRPEQHRVEQKARMITPGTFVSQSWHRWACHTMCFTSMKPQPPSLCIMFVDEEFNCRRQRTAHNFWDCPMARKQK